MKIVLTVHTAYPDFIGGREHHVHYLASELARTDKVIVIAGGRSKKEQSRFIDGYKLITLPMISIKVSSNPLQIYRIIPKLFSRIKKEKPDILHAFEYGSFSTDIAYFYAKTYRIPLLLSVYGYQFNKLLLQWSKKLYDKTIGRALLKDASKIFFSSKTQQDEILSIINDKTITDKMILQNNTIRVDDYQGANRISNFAREHRINTGLILLTVARLLPRKGIKYLILALHNIKKKKIDQNIKLLIVGPDCGELANIKHLVKMYKLDDNVTFIGPISQHKVKDFLNICDIFILPSLYEALPLALLEAMASSKAVIFTDLLCAKSIIINGENGLLVKPGDPYSLGWAIIRLMDDENFRHHLGINAGKSIRKYDSFLESKLIRTEYSKVLNSRKYK
jgi:glycosyltransferase involved in cell wall biosynthesis